MSDAQSSAESARREAPRPPAYDELVVQCTTAFVNLAALRVVAGEHRDLGEARKAIDLARALLEHCPEQAVRPLRDALSSVQLSYARAVTEGGAQHEKGPEAGREQAPGEATGGDQ